MLELISVHVPKCAGSSFQHGLLEAYGRDHVHLDYGDRVADPAAPINLDPAGFLERANATGPLAVGRKVAVHGHFYVAKYAFAPRTCRRITFLRNPIDRTISNYHFWRGFPRHGHVLHDYMLDRNLTLLEFARLPYIRHFYTRVYFRDIDRNVFDFVGSVETLDRDVAAVSELLGRPLAVGRVNEGDKTETAPEIREELCGLLQEDTAFYRRWCERA